MLKTVPTPSLLHHMPYALIVDDERQLAQNMARYLGRHGFDTQTVHSVGEAHQAMTQRKPDIALVDLKLPDASGVDLCRTLHLRFPDLPVLVVSATMNDQSTKTLRGLGVRGMLAKPFALTALLAQVRQVLSLQTSDAPVCKLGFEPMQTSPVAAIHNAVGSLHARRTESSPRIVLYSHDTMGLGHMRRNILLARTLVESRLKASVLLVSGAREIGRFELPVGIDCLVLPSYSKSTEGDYRSRHLDMETRELANLRAHTINVSVPAFDPDVLIVDNVPRGALNELDAVLATLNSRGRTRCVLGLRDVLDAPQRVVQEWKTRNNLAAIDWHYDQVWVYGDPAIYNLCEEYAFGAAFAAKTRFTGYLDARKRAVPKTEAEPPAQVDAPSQPYNLCLVGGGQDGYELARAFALSPQPEGCVGVLVSGPFMQPHLMRELESLAANRSDFILHGFVPEPTLLLQQARRVVAMGGYNTVNEVLAFGRPTLVVPRVAPREEQLVRAQRLAERGHIDMLHPDQLTAAAIGDWLAQPLRSAANEANQIDLEGLGRLIDLTDDLLNDTHQTGEICHAHA